MPLNDWDRWCRIFDWVWGMFWLGRFFCGHVLMWWTWADMLLTEHGCRLMVEDGTLWRIVIDLAFLLLHNSYQNTGWKIYAS